MKQVKKDSVQKCKSVVLKKELKVVLYRLKHFPGNDKYRKSQLINQLLCKEKRNLGLTQSNQMDLLTEDENNIAEEIISEIVKKRKMEIFNSRNESDASIPLEYRQTNDREKKEPTDFPVIPKHKFNKYLALLSGPQQVSEHEKVLNQCLARLHSTVKPHWMSPSCIMKAINHSFLHRKWNNLTQLVLMLMHFPQQRYAPVIRHMCQIMARLHPDIRLRGFQDQFKMVHQVHKRSS